MFPNQFSVYMHDTPHRELFARDARAFSNGCIRLEKPVELAAHPAGRAGRRPGGGLRRLGGGEDGAPRRPGAADPGAHRLSHRLVRRDRRRALPRRTSTAATRKVFEALEAAGVTLPAAQG